ncbi:hypothetical protein BDF20DRAFT_860235 [Mycotypha africana]|uniref:uncharacterized protein n=1 Tax=Mycotypha africana TaxID=64632 RepID=UPI0023005A16|nr:uncharacterized protein BDF20DRAFT_860235 [Mycotypha africana]KAI8984482.1 hypothetical protein BDF20DRAFT_860235 [Mycotypha africana]
MGNNISSDDNDIWTHQQQVNNNATQAVIGKSSQHSQSSAAAIALKPQQQQQQPSRDSQQPSTAFRKEEKYSLTKDKSMLATISEKQQLEDHYNGLFHRYQNTPSPFSVVSYYDQQPSRHRCHSRASPDSNRYSSSIMNSGFSSAVGGDSFHFSSVADSTITDFTNASTFSINSFLDKASDEKNDFMPFSVSVSNPTIDPHHPIELESLSTAQAILDLLLKKPEAIYDVFSYVLSHTGSARNTNHTEPCDAAFQKEAFLAMETWSLRATDTFAKVMVACCRLYGWGTEREPELGFHDLQSLAKRGVWEAFYFLGQCYHYGLASDDTAMDREKALYWYAKLVENAENAANYQQAQLYVAEAQFRIVAIQFAAGKITFDNLHENVDMLKQSADSGNRKAEFSFGLMLDSGVIKDDVSALEYYERSAIKGYAPAQVQLGLSLIRNGSSEGIDWLKKAAEEQHDAWAYYYLGESYEFGRCVEVDKLAAYQCYSNAAEGGNHYLAQFRLGMHFLYGGLGLQKDLSKAFQYLKTSARAGYHDAQYLLGMMYRQGNIPELSEPCSPSSKNTNRHARKLRHEKEAFRWIRRAATQGMHTAITQIAHCYEEGIGTAVNHALATEYYSIAVKIAGKHLPSAQLTYARFLHKSGHYSKALELYLLAAGIHGSTLNTVPSSPVIARVAKRMVALIYLDKSDTTTPYEPKEALDLLFSLADCPEGDADAHYWIAVCYEEGVPDVLAVNLQKAYEHYLISAHLGSSDSLFQVGYMLCKGIGVKEDKGAAFSWFQRSADRNHADALFYVGIYHYNANAPLLKRDHEQARLCFRKAAESNHVEAMVAYAQLCQDKLNLLSSSSAADAAEMKRLQTEVMRWYTKAAKRNSIKALRELGRIYTVKGDFKNALESYLKAVSHNDGLSTLILGGFYENGQGMTANTQIALKCYAKAYELGQATALFASAELYEKLQKFSIAYAYYQRVLQEPKISHQLLSKKMSKLKIALYSLHYCPTTAIFAPTDLTATMTQPYLFESIPSLLPKSEAFQLLLTLGKVEQFDKAKYWIAKCYFDGNGTRQDRVEASRWLSTVSNL